MWPDQCHKMSPKYIILRKNAPDLCSGHLGIEPDHCFTKHIFVCHTTAYLARPTHDARNAQIFETFHHTEQNVILDEVKLLKYDGNI